MSGYLIGSWNYKKYGIADLLNDVTYNVISPAPFFSFNMVSIIINCILKIMVISYGGELL
jgi:hypothetical protein